MASLIFERLRGFFVIFNAIDFQRTRAPAAQNNFIQPNVRILSQPESAAGS
jgi:hypothetical protein